MGKLRNVKHEQGWRRVRAAVWRFLWRPSRERSIAAGVLLLGVPTFFSIFTTATNWPRWWRVAIGAGWLVIAVGAVIAETNRGSTIDRLAAGRAETLRGLRVTATLDVLQSLVRSGTRGMPDSYEFTIYRLEKNRLVPFFPRLQPPLEPDPRVFQEGAGATGLAWKERDVVVVVRGDDVSNAEYGLSEAQQAFYGGFRSVASAVIWHENTTPIGVLTALSRDDDEYFALEASRDALKQLAQTIGVVLTRIPEAHDLES